MNILEDIEQIISLAKIGEKELWKREILKKHNCRIGNIYENIITKKQFIITGVSHCGRLEGVGLNNDHIGYYYLKDCTLINWKLLDYAKNKNKS